MSYKIEMSTKFKKDYKLIVKRGYDQRLLQKVIQMLAAEEKLHKSYRDHALTGNYNGHRKCHITPDWLLIYRVEEDVLILALTRTGTHSDLF